MVKYIETPFDRQFRVGETHLTLRELDGERREIGASLTKEVALEIGIALIESAGKTLGELAKEEAEREERERAEKLQGRRDELAKKFSANGAFKYIDCGTSGRNAIDYIIELEDAAKPKYEL